jgi:hypothetical protein
MDDFLLTGRIAQLEIGMRISEVYRILGPPEDNGSGIAGIQIASYNGRSLQISHVSNVVILIAIYFRASIGKNWAWLTALQFQVPFSDRTTLSEFKTYLKAHHIPWKTSYVFPDSGDLNLKMGRNTMALFQNGYLVSLQSVQE